MQTKVYKISEEDRLEIRNYLDIDHREEMKQLVSQGLTAKRKWLHCKYLYDQRGSELFDQICQTEEYYLTRIEQVILERHAKEIMEFFALNGGDLVEIGSGSNHKIRRLLAYFSPRPRVDLRYVPFDISETALVESSRELLELYPKLRVLGIVGDYTRHLTALPSGRKLILFLGSTLGNFDEKESLELLQGITSAMNKRDRFLLGLDMVKPVETLEAAYNDSQGVTSRFTKNILVHLNRELKAEFNLDDFEHYAFYNPERECMEIHLQARRKLTCFVGDLDLKVCLAQGETIHVEISQKFTREKASGLFQKVGLTPTRWFHDDQGWFYLVELAKAGYT